MLMLRKRKEEERDDCIILPFRLITIPSIPGNYPSQSLCTITPHNTFSEKTENRNTLNCNMYNNKSRYGNNTSHLYGDNNHNIHIRHPNNNLKIHCRTLTTSSSMIG